MNRPAENIENEKAAADNVIYGALEGQDARLLAARAREIMPADKVLVHVALDDTRMATLKELLGFFAPDAQVIEFPAWDCLPYDRVSPNADIVAKRVFALIRMRAWEKEAKRTPRIVLTTINAITQRVMPKDVLAGASFTAKKGGRIDVEALHLFLTQNGYSRTQTVREAGEYAMRGGIIDLFPPGYVDPLRLDLFGDEIESIKAFDPLTQCTSPYFSSLHGLSVQSGDHAHKACDDVTITLQPVTEFFLNEESIDRFRSGYRAVFGVVQGSDPLYEAVSEGRRYNGMEHWLPLFYQRMDTLLSYIPAYDLILDHHARRAEGERLDQIRDFYQSRQTLKDAALKKKKKSKDISLSGAFYNPLAPERLYLDEGEWGALIADAYLLSPFQAPHPNPLPGGEGSEAYASRREELAAAGEGTRKARDFADIRALPDGDVMGELRTHLSSLQGTNVTKQSMDCRVEADASPRNDRKMLITAYSQGSLQRLQTMMEAAGIANIKIIADREDFKKLRSHEIGLTVLSLEHGFTAPDLAVLTEADILGDRLVRKTSKRKKAENFLREVSALDEGDLVAHIDHGIGKFIALETVTIGKIHHDCLKIEYAGGDRLFVPVENIEVLSRFGSDEGTVQLDKLGGAGWQARKARVKKDLMEMADGLLKIAAERLLRKIDPIEIPQELYNEFAARFPYAETDDQERAINDVLESLAGSHPMDRLVCGDVGFGKTEVALRAAYVAAMDGFQVAIVAPTTLLARQHTLNFTKRFAGTKLRVEQLSRLVSAKDAKAAKEGLADGSVNIVIGTHALFGKGIKFANLGLLVVDEEQRFGVKQKERLKELKSNVHVLTLSATPIPRTLQMSLTGVKEMSLITTPPVDRLAVRTFVMPMDTHVIREALLREHYRGGQSFYVCPRIADMDELEEMLKELVPEVKVITAHGQMSAGELEDRMSAFYEGQYEVLLATNIIESGIDIPRANTLVIHRADMFGLAQLYQIRGRIGRSKVRAYAYLTYPADALLNPQAQKRLEVMETLDTLGSGFQLASHDMDIRGAGNLLGDQQSGHIKEVGVELYQQMLEEAVAMAREGVSLDDIPQDRDWSPTINLGASVLISEEYVPDLGVRMSLYRRIADLGSSMSFPRCSEAALKQRGSSDASGEAADVMDPVCASASDEARQRDDSLEGEDIDSFAAELIDRFGDLPEEVQNLLDIVAIKQLCKKAGVSSVEGGPKGAVIAFHNNTPPNIEGLMHWMTSKGGALKMRPDQKLVAIRHWDTLAKRIKGVQSLMKELAAVAA
ncbi:MAG: transcription-repair coupling factor [Rhodospirillales bacterium]|nr:transcription-repair coupling factor [Rhodospirillales bacterium]